jgi:hypothetical protein
VAKYKAAALVIVRARVRALGTEAEAALLERLSPDQRACWETLTATQWVPMQTAEALLGESAPILYPHDVDPSRTLGAALASEMMGGIYRYVLRVVSVPFLIGQTATVWSRFQDTGAASTEQLTPASARLVVRQHPTLPPHVRRTITGWLEESIRKTGARSVRAEERGGPAQWEWVCHWR